MLGHTHSDFTRSHPLLVMAIVSASAALYTISYAPDLPSGRGMGHVTCHKWPSPTTPQHISHLLRLLFSLTFGQDPHLSVNFPLGRVQEAEVSSRPHWSVLDEMPCVWSTTNHLEDTINGCELHDDQHDHRARFSSTWQLVHTWDCAPGVGGSVQSTPFPFILLRFNELIYCLIVSLLPESSNSWCHCVATNLLSGYQEVVGCCP